MQRTLVLNVVGLTPRLLGHHTPALSTLKTRGAGANVRSMLPAVTCSVQATYLTGTWPAAHGIVGNGWYDRDDAEVKFWKQSDRLVQRPRIWDLARPQFQGFTCANAFWWHAMYSGADYTLTPRPMYPADGRKLPDVWTHPPELRDTVQHQLGQFPLFNFWGPLASIESTRWIVSAALELERRYRPSLQLVYLPHLDYPLQKLGPDHPSIPAELRAVDAEAKRLIDAADAEGVAVMVVSEYGITPVNQPVHVNRVLREGGFVTVREERGRETLDAGASRAFAVADHQVAHVYVRDPADVAPVFELLAAEPGVDALYAGLDRTVIRLGHARSGDIVLIAKPGAWFTYYFWLDDARAPDYARTVDIHRKPGYDPAELFIDPELPAPRLKLAAKLAARKLGFRNLLDVTPLDATLVRGSHGAIPPDPLDGPLVLSGIDGLLDRAEYDATDVAGLILKHLQSR